MTESTILDVLLGAIIVLVGLIGYWQGVARSMLVIGGGLLGSELALWWSDDTGDWLADVFPVNDDTGRFIASTALILGASLVLGVLLGNMVSRPASGIRERLSGIAVSTVSALLIIGLVIRYFHIHMAARAENALADTTLASALWEQFDWIVLGSALGGMALLALFWVLGAPDVASVNAGAGSARSWAAAPPAYDSSYRSLTPQSAREAAGPSSNNDYAVYSASDGGSAKQAKSSNSRHPAVESPVDYSSKSDFASQPDLKAEQAFGDEREATSAVRSSSASSAAFERHAAPASETFSFLDDNRESGDEVSSGICPNCGMLLTSGDQFCPDCGNPID